VVASLVLALVADILVLAFHFDNVKEKFFWAVFQIRIRLIRIQGVDDQKLEKICS
jgi:hypothetical protein